ncbi:beclin 1-associated autophagy-related key regulator isoform X2 [Chrysoperla carnea]|uniref:beclin 1-associated autophagy-related key regulator isoform X2 n=1 Tax=Chrysoperla carnea TaxID=189513 RepID=UPI001D08E465|nr:beclin 1-associated autophagy-related key regulator isoform X2 [Chrysoperla carnea]
MATVNDSSDESVAPKDFHLSSSLDSGSVFTFNHQICQLCNNFRKTFYCKQCIRNGDFTYSTSSYSERFSEKQLRLHSLRNSKQLVQEKCEKLLKKKINYDQLISETKQCNQRIVYLRKLIDATKKRKTTAVEQLGQIKKKNHDLKMRLPRYRDRVLVLERCVEDYPQGIVAKKNEIDESLKELKKLTHKHIEKLIKYIFPISKVLPTPPQSVESTLSSRSNEDSVSEVLAEAQQTVYVRDRWIQLSDHETSGGVRYRIVAPTLPGSGDFSSYNDWVASHKDSEGSMLSGSGEGCVSKLEQNVAFTISAALTYTAQLVNVLAFYLDVRLPYKMTYSDFSSGYMSEGQFARRVARLNANVLHLCFSQSVNPYLLRPTATIHNILCLINPELSDLGRRGPVEIDPKEAFFLEQQLSRDLENSEEDSGSEDDILPWEWESVPHVQCPEVGILAMGSNHNGVAGGSQVSTVGTTSIAGGLVTSAAASIASLWRGWTAGGR